MKTIFAALGLFCLVMVAYAGQPEKSEWAGFEFLVGDWVADRDNQTAASGDFSFRFAAGGKVLVRRNAADYPAANGRQSSHHEDLLVIYREHDNGPASAMYFDSEGHVIRYEVAVDAKLHRVQLLSNSSDATPRYRLTYRQMSEGKVSGDFEIATSAKDQFAPYLHWTAHRVSRE